jgi:methionyl-tRNA formyltransferase
MKILFFGSPEFVLPIPVSLEKHFDLIGIVTQPDAKMGRKQELTPTAVKKAYAEKVPVFTPEKFDATVLAQIAALQPDMFIVAAYGKIIPDSLLHIPLHGSLNIHPSKLPLYRGATPIQSAIRNGDTITALSIISMDEQMDHGPIVYQEDIPIDPFDTFETLSTLMFQKAAEVLPHVISQFIEKKITPLVQDESMATYCSVMTKDAGFIDSNNLPNTKEFDRMLRAYYPWPGVWTKIRMAGNKEMRIKFYPDNKVQMEGKKTIGIKDFFNGYPELREQLETLYQK